MSYPALIPSGRSFGAGDFPVKAYKAQDGAEVRLLYGNKRVGMSLSLNYDNIPDSSAALFIEHYHEMKGTYQQFVLGTPAKGGWGSDLKWLGAVEWGSMWRYASEPKVQSVRPGVSTVSVELVAATTT